MINLDAHWPYPPSKDATSLWVRDYAGPINGYLFRANLAGGHPDAADKQHVRPLRRRAVGAGFGAVDRFPRQALEARRRPTLFTADHGEALGEGDHWSHDDLLLMETRVPMLPSPRPRAAGRREGRSLAWT
jgi:hypothetical protein